MRYGYLTKFEYMNWIGYFVNGKIVEVVGKLEEKGHRNLYLCKKTIDKTGNAANIEGKLELVTDGEAIWIPYEDKPLDAYDNNYQDFLWIYENDIDLEPAENRYMKHTLERIED